MNTIFPEGQQNELGKVGVSMIQLCPTLWLDLDSAVIIRDQEQILLTAREVHVLSILVQVMRHTRSHISAQAIAQRIGLTSGDPGHCIEESISSIRRKLGEVPRHPQILQERRGLGYRLFPVKT